MCIFLFTFQEEEASIIEAAKQQKALQAQRKKLLEEEHKKQLKSKEKTVQQKIDSKRQKMISSTPGPSAAQAGVAQALGKVIGGRSPLTKAILNAKKTAGKAAGRAAGAAGGGAAAGGNCVKCFVLRK